MVGLIIIVGVIAFFYFVDKTKSNSKSTSTGNRMASVQYKSQQSSSYGTTVNSVRRVALETSTEIPPDFDFNEELQYAFDLMETTRKHIFVTGKAGTGKSTLLEYFRIKTKKNIAVLAPTGVAAIKAHGQTIHSFFKFPPRFIQKDHIRRLRNSELLKHLDTLVIDEASMMRADLLDGIDSALRANREEHDTPFGGVQIIIFGDLFQLPPVVEKEIRDFMDKLYSSPYFFSALVIENIDLKYVELHKIYRQKDTRFIDLLNKIRIKKLDENDLRMLNERVNHKIGHDSSGVITLTTTNNDANNINVRRLAKIQSKEYKYHAQIWGDFGESSYPTEACLTLKKGAQIMLIKNDKDKNWVNGTIGEIVGLSESYIKVSVGNGIYEVPRVSWEKVEYIYNPTKEKIDEKVVGSFEQYPIKLAWAITIHKSQGQTFQNVIINMGYGAFTHGQTYVALSRCTSLEGISLKKPIIHSDIIFDDRIYQFENRSKKTGTKQIKLIKSVSEKFSNIPEHQRISISKIKDSRCPFRYFKNYIQEPKEDKPFLSIELGLGQYFHSVVEKMFKMIAAQERPIGKKDVLDIDSMLNEFEMSFTWNNKLREPYKIVRRGCDFNYFKTRLATIANNFNSGVIPKLINHKVLKTEGSLEIKADCYTIRGKYDLLTQDQNKKIILWDWKTGAAPKPDFYEAFTLQKVQLGIYAIWIKHKHKSDNVCANAVFLRDGASFLQETFEHRIEKMVTDFIDKEYKYLKTLTDYIPIPSGLCAWCSWNPKCPTYK